MRRLILSTIVMVVLVVACIALLLDNGAAGITSFDNKFRAEKLDLNAPVISLETEGNPTFTSFDLTQVPTTMFQIKDVPRRFSVSDICLNLTIPENTVGIKALSELPNQGIIKISTPPLATGTVVICATTKTAVPVVLWAVTK